MTRAVDVRENAVHVPKYTSEIAVYALGYRVSAHCPVCGTYVGGGHFNTDTPEAAQRWCYDREVDNYCRNCGARLKKEVRLQTDDEFSFPCTAGDTVFFIADEGSILEGVVDHIEIMLYKDGQMQKEAVVPYPDETRRHKFEDFGVTVFLTHVAADKVLTERLYGVKS